MATTIPGGGGVTAHHILPIFGVPGEDGHRGISQGMGGGLRSFGGAPAGTSHGHTGSANLGGGSHEFGDRGGGQIRGERFGSHSQSSMGHDTINLGSGHDSLAAASAHVGFHTTDHSTTMVGGTHHTNFVGHAHSMIAHTGAGSDSYTGGAAIVHGTTGHLTAMFADHKVGADVIKNFVTGHDKLMLEGRTLQYLHSHANVTVSHGDTNISLHGGDTTITLKGISHMSSIGGSGHK
jgi:hypothetical protein